MFNKVPDRKETLLALKNLFFKVLGKIELEIKFNKVLDR